VSCFFSATAPHCFEWSHSGRATLATTQCQKHLIQHFIELSVARACNGSHLKLEIAMHSLNLTVGGRMINGHWSPFDASFLQEGLELRCFEMDSIVTGD
jgi:hypothetical protein